MTIDDLRKERKDLLGVIRKYKTASKKGMLSRDYSDERIAGVRERISQIDAQLARDIS